MKSSIILIIGLIASLIFAFTSESFLILLLALIFIAAVMRIANSDRPSEFKSRLGNYFHGYLDRRIIGQQTFTDEQQWPTGETRRYVPFRYQAIVAPIVAGLLYFHLFQTFTFQESSGLSCNAGSLLRPVIDWDDGSVNADVIQKVGWSWNLGSAHCPEVISARLDDMFHSFIALAICVIVMRRTNKRE